MSLAEEVRALRASAGLSRPTHVAIVHVDGEDALDFLQGAMTQSPYLRVGRVRHTLLLRDDASVLADAFVVNLGEGFLVLAEGPDESSMVAWLTSLKEGSPAKRVSIRGWGADDWVLFGVDGPYAWEIVAGLLGPAVLGLPYLTLMAQGELLCLRAGKTGEYGYLVLVRRSDAATVEARLREIGGPVDLAIVGREALDICALESWHFTMRMLRSDNALRLTPLELQLQWRVVHTREFLGAPALRLRLAGGAKTRATCFTSQAPVAAGQRLRLGELEVGEVLAACHSPTLGRTVGAALLRHPFAHPHLDLSAMAGAEQPIQHAIPIRTETASLVFNESLRIKPHLGQAYAMRGRS